MPLFPTQVLTALENGAQEIIGQIIETQPSLIIIQNSFTKTYASHTLLCP